jgi:nitrite reductase (cytochrome c-552)
MADETTPNPVKDVRPAGDTPPAGKKRMVLFIGVFILTALLSAGVAWLLTTIMTRKQEAAMAQFVRKVEVTDETTDPAVWGENWPDQYDAYKKTSQSTRTRFGGSETLPQSKIDKDPWLKRMFGGYAFAIDYNDRRGHAFMLFDQEVTKRVTTKPQPGACLHCHASIIPLYREVGLAAGATKDDAVMKGFELVNPMPYKDAHDYLSKDGKKMVNHPVSCVDCHDPKTMHLRVTRPGFINGIKALKEFEGAKDYDVNRDASHQEMRSFVCGQCHVEYYFKGKEKKVTFPWANGLKVEQIEEYYDKEGWIDYKQAETGAPILKAQHPEFEMWSQGIHGRSGVSCADCHMPYMRQGAMKISDHWVRSPLLNISNACQTCHPMPESKIQARVEIIQTTTQNAMQRAAAALMDMMDTIMTAKKAGASEEQLKPVLALHRKAQWRLDYVAAENSMGFHAPQEATRILGEAADYARQGQVEALKVWAALTKDKPAGAVAPAAPVTPAK